jgi:hypothetical protein
MKVTVTMEVTVTSSRSLQLLLKQLCADRQPTGDWRGTAHLYYALRYNLVITKSS